MRILNGWKEIAEFLNLTQRTAQRWERLGLPVRRVSDSPRSPIVAFHHEIEGWVRHRTTRLQNSGTLSGNLLAYRATRLETQKLVRELRAARTEHYRLIKQIRDQIGERQESSPHRSSKSPSRSLFH
jgi:phage terminase Nu1 subunit (DNA packaging protein)